jgi:hypothetical protein
MSAPDYTGLWKLLYDWQTIIAGALALVAGVPLVCVGFRQLKALQRSVNIAVDVESPKVFFQSAILAKRGVSNLAARLQYPGAEITFVNYGRTPAFLTQSCIQFTKGNLPNKPNYNTITNMMFGETIESKGKYTFTHNHGHDLGRGHIDEIINGRMILWLYGFIAYRDFLNRHHKVGFCLRLECFEPQQRAEFALGHGPAKYTYTDLG